MTSDKRTFHVHPNLETSEEEPSTLEESSDLEALTEARPLTPRAIPRPPPMPVYVNTRPDYMMPPEPAPRIRPPSRRDGDEEEELPEAIDPAIFDHVRAPVNPGPWVPPTPTFPELVFQEEE